MARLWLRHTAYTSARGQALIELLVAFGIFALFSAGVTTLSVDALWTLQTGPEYTGASAYAQEGLEAARQIADRSWALMAVGNHGVTLETAGNETYYAFTGTSDTRGIYTRVVSLTEIQRDANGAIVESGGTIDPDSRRVTSTVSWRTGFTSRQQQVSTNTLVTNWDSRSWTETLKTEFEEGLLTSAEAYTTAAPPTGNGSVRIQSSPGSPGGFEVKGAISFNAGGPSDGRDIAVAGSYAYMVTSLGAGGARFYVVDASTVTSPKKVAELDPGGKLFAIALFGNYAYVATDRNQGELRVIDITNPENPVLGAEYDLDSSTDAISVAVEGTTLYVGTNGNTSPGSNPELYIFSLTNPAAPALVGSLEIPSNPNVNGVAPVGPRVYLATSDGAQEFMTVDVSTPSLPLLVGTGTEDLTNCNNATSVVTSGTRAYVSCTGTNGFHTVSITTPDNPTVLGTLALDGAANDITVSGSYGYVATEASAKEFQRVNITNPAALTVEGTTDLDGPARAIAISGPCVYITTDGNEQEMAIVCPTGGEEGISEGGAWNAPGTADARSIALSGTTAILGTADAVYTVDVTAPTTPTVLDSISLDGSVEDIAVQGSIAYLATTRNAAELTVVDIANPSAISILGTYDTTDPAYSVAVTGPDLYLGTGGSDTGTFFTLDVSTPSTPLLRGQVATEHPVTDIAVDNTDANTVFISEQSTASPSTIYSALCGESGFLRRLRPLARWLEDMRIPLHSAQAFSHAPSAEDREEFRRVDVTNPAAPTLGALANPHEIDSGRGVFSSGSSLYAVTGDKTGTLPEFYILQYQEGALGLESSGSALNIGGTVNDVVQYDPLAFLGTSIAQKEFVVVDVSDHGSPTIRGVFNLCGEANALAVAGTYAYIATTHDEKELIILKGIDAATYQLTGTVESIPFNGSQSWAWERLGWSQTLNGGSITFQVRWATPTQALPTCATALAAVQFVGPNDNPANPSNPSGSYTTSGSLITNETGQSPSAQCFQWRATLNGTGSASPELHDVTITFR